MFALTDRVAVVTGSSSGIGDAVARRYLCAGARVYGIDLEPGGDAWDTTIADVSKEHELRGALADIAADSDGIDILVNNAAIQPLGIPFSELSETLLRRTLEVNVHGVAFGVKHAPTFMGARGRIINTTSFVGQLGVPGGSAYAISKAAVSHITRCAAIELAARGITVNAIAPGTVLTPVVTEIPDNPELDFVTGRTPAGRLAGPEELTGAYHFLASDEAAYVTGAILPVDGGLAAGWDSYDLPPAAAAGFDA